MIHIAGVSLIYIQKKEIFQFDSFDFEDFNKFQNGQKLLNKILYGIEKFNKKNNKITLITLKFSMREYEKIKNKNRLSETASDLLHLMNECEKNNDLKGEIIVHLVDVRNVSDLLLCKLV